MVEQARTNQELLKGISFLKKKIKKLEKSEAQQKPTAMALHKSEHNYRKLAEDMPALICTFSPDSTLTYVNKAYCELFQKQPEDLVGQKFLDFLPDGMTRENVRRQYLSLTPENPVKTYEHKVIVSDGTNQYHWHRWTDRAFFSDEGQISYFQSIGQDITDHKRIEAALRESEEKYRLLANRMTDVVWTSDLNFITTYLSPSVEYVLGAPPEESMKIPFEEQVTPETYARVLERLTIEMAKEESGQAAQERTVMLEMEYYHRNGSIVWMENIISAIRNADGQLIGLQGVARDITDRKRAREALLESEELFRVAMERAPDGVYMNDLEGNFLYGNKKAEEIIGYKREELIGRNFLDLNIIAETSMSEAAELLKENIEGRSTGPDELEIIRKDGKHIMIDISTNVIQLGGQKNVLAFVRDITERKRMDEELRESETRFRQLADSTWEGILIHREGIVLDGNQALFDMFGYETTETIGRYFIDFITPEFKEKAVETLKLGDKSSLLRFEGKGQKKNGTVFPFEALGRPITHNNIPARVIAVRDLTERIGAEQKLQETLESLRKAIRATIQVLVTAVETRDPYTAGHQDRSAALANAIATEMGLPQDKINGIQMAGSIHDIGKLSIPAEILSKPTNLTEIEFPLIKEHAKKGFEMLKDVESPWPLAEIIYQHHERMDGSGYPRHLKGEEIIMEARILAVADVVESMASHRPYRPALGLNMALEEIEDNKGTLYDADAVDACLRLFRKKGYQLEGTRF